MFLATSNKALRLLHLSYCGQVGVAELERHRQDIKTLLADLGAGFRVLVDLSRLESMELECVPLLGEWMEFIDGSGLELVVRVIPDPRQDIGFGILGVFHYRNCPQVVTCANMTEAAKVLGL